MPGPWPGPGRFGVLLALFGPRDREAGVEDAARVEGGGGRVDHRHRGDRLEARRVLLGGEQLADPAVGDPEHPDLVVRAPTAVWRSSRSRRSRRGSGAFRRSRTRRRSIRCRACSRRPPRSPSGWRARRSRFPGLSGSRTRSRSTRSASDREACSSGVGHALDGSVGKWNSDGTPGSPAGLVGGWTSIASWVPSRVVR